MRLPRAVGPRPRNPLPSHFNTFPPPLRAGGFPGLGPGWPRTPCALHRSCRQPCDEAALDTRTAAQDTSVGADALGCGPTLGVLGEENEEGWAAMLLAVLIKKRHSSPIPPYPTLPGRVHSHAGEFAEGSLPPWSASSRGPPPQA